MDPSMLDAAGQALVTIMDPYRLMLLGAGVVMGLVLGILPGIGGLAGTALLLPFTFNMDPYAAFALLLGLGATTATGDPIPAIMFGVPGGAGSAATVLDGLPMAKRGEAGRALSAAYMSSMLGGIFGAFLMAITLPLLRPIMLYLGSPELLAFAALGISMVAVLSGSAPLRGLAAACFGIMLAMIGSDPQTGTLRWTLDSLYLWEGLPLVPVVLGLFALPELADLMISRTAIAADTRYNIKSGMWQGAKDCFTNWWLVLRCSWLGAALGAVPGIGGSIIDWLAYGHAIRTEKGAQQTFGKGDVRGVIASESANNAKEGGALIPTIAFGVPGSAGMAILLGAFLIHGLVPGPDMLGKNLNITYAMVWSIAIANILGAGLCYLFSGQFARLATLRYTLILPSVLGIIYIGAFQGSRHWGDLYALLFFGVLGWVMKQAKWPRPPLLLGVVLGEIIERYMFISVERYGVSWMARPARRHPVRHGHLRPPAAVLAGREDPRRLQAHAHGFRQAALRPDRAVHGVPDRARLGHARPGLRLEPVRQDRAGDRRRDGARLRDDQPPQHHLPQPGRTRGGGDRRGNEARGRAEDPHGSRIRHGSPVDPRSCCSGRPCSSAGWSPSWLPWRRSA